MRRTAKWIAIGVVVVAALYFGGGGIAAGLFLGHLFKVGEVDWSGAGQPAPSDPLTLGYRGDPKAALGLDFTTVHYDTDLGPAEAWLVPATAPTKTWAIYVHGVGGIRENGYKQLSILREAGLPTLLITYRNDAGAPKGQPAFYSLGLTEWRDLDAAIGWMLANGADRVVLVAESMGGAITGQFLRHSDKAGKVEALVLDAPAVDFQQAATDILERFHLPFAPILSAIGMQVLSIESGLPYTDTRTTPQVAAFPGPIFLAHGRGDRLVPIATSEELVRLRQGGAPTTFLETDADHLRSFEEDPAKYRSELLTFLAALPPA